MAPAPYILAADYESAHKFAYEQLGLGKGHFYIVTSPRSLKGLRGTDLHMVPGWRKRADRFKMDDVLRWTALNKIDYENMPEEAAVVDQVVTEDQATEFFDQNIDVDEPAPSPIEIPTDYRELQLVAQDLGITPLNQPRAALEAAVKAAS